MFCPRFSEWRFRPASDGRGGGQAWLEVDVGLVKGERCEKSDAGTDDAGSRQKKRSKWASATQTYLDRLCRCR